jgi:hypothetical protein
MHGVDERDEVDTVLACLPGLVTMEGFELSGRSRRHLAA